MKFKSVVIGLGQIGIGYDLYSSGNILTHVNALTAHQGFELCGGVDRNKDRRLLLEKSYSVPAYESVRDAVKGDPDIVVVATPTKTHLEVVLEVLKFCSPLVILCEKPLSGNLNEAQEILRLAEERNFKLVVNYVRRFEPGAIAVGERLRSGQLGVEINGVARYSRSLLNNGSHIVNLLQSWLGELIGVQETSRRETTNGVVPTPDLLLEFSTGEVLLIANRVNNYTVFEIDLFGSNGRICYQRSGLKISWWGVHHDPNFRDSKTLASEPEEISNELLRYQWHVYQHISNILSIPQQTLLSTGRDAVETLKQLEPWLSAADE